MKALIAIALVLTLSACAGFSQGVASAGRTVCEHEFETRAALELALEKATTIKDQTAREDALLAIQASLKALDLCPKAPTS